MCIRRGREWGGRKGDEQRVTGHVIDKAGQEREEKGREGGLPMLITQYNRRKKQGCTTGHKTVTSLLHEGDAQ